MESSFYVGVRDQSHTAEARRAAMQLATELAFDESEAGGVGLVVTEAVKNLLKHAGGGDLIVRGLDGDGGPAVEMVAIDKGPGMDVGRTLEDGYSTAGTPGTGLGAITRLSSFHDIYSQPSQGTALLARVSRRRPPASRSGKPASAFCVGAVSAPKHGEPVCGDAWTFLDLPPGAGRAIVADGLGHGLLAADAARASIRIADEYRAESGVDLMRRIHDALRPTRGAAVALAEIENTRGIVRYTGVGNIAGHVVSPSGRVHHLVSHPGTAGHEARKIAEFTYPWSPGSFLIMHSDGLSSHWSLDRYPGLLRHHPALVAAVLYRDFTRGRDDATVLVVQEKEAGQCSRS